MKHDYTKPITVAQLRKALRKYRGGMEVWQGGVGIKTVRITAVDEKSPATCVVRLIRLDEERA